MSSFLRLRWSLVGMLLLLFSGISLAHAANFSSFRSNVYTGLHKVKAIDTDHFTVEYSQAISSGADSDMDGVPDLVEDISTYAEFSWDKEVNGLGLPNPLVNYANYPNGLNQARLYLILDDTDLYLLEGSVGSTSVMSDRSLYMAVDPTISKKLLEVTVAHEFLHAIQFSYQGDFIGYDQDLNFAEQTAVAVEDYVYNDVNDYWNYLRHYFNYPDYSILTGVVPEGSLFEYGLGIWPRFLVEYFDDWTVLTEVITTYFAQPVPDVWDSFEAYRDVIETQHGANFEEVYQDFSLWNYLSSYEEGDHYPAPIVHATYHASDYPLNQVTIDNDYLPALFGTNYLQFYVAPSQWGKDFKLTLNKPVDVDLGVMVLPETSNTYLVESGKATIIPEGMDRGVLTIPIDQQVSLYTVMISPLSKDPSKIETVDEAFSVGYAYDYSVEVGDFIEGNEIKIESFLGQGGSTDEAVKEGDTPGVNLPEGNADISGMDALTVHELAVTSYDATSVSLTWSRVQSQVEVAGYRVYYGDESGNYTFSQDVSGAYVTHLTIKNLSGSGKHYFAVKGLSVAGVESRFFSNEVAVQYDSISGLTNSSSLSGFPDVPVSNKYYEAVHFLTSIDIFKGYPNGSFYPNKTINRAELMKILAVSDLESMDTSAYRDCFPDVNDQWFAPYVCYGAEMGWIQGYPDGLFHPERTVSRAETLKIIYKSAEVVVPSLVRTGELPYKDVFGSAWFAPYVAQAYKDGLLENTGVTFGPDQGQSRAQVAEIIYRYLVALWFDDGEPFTKERGTQFQTEWADWSVM